MGIDGFLRQLSDAIDRTHLQQLAGETLVVDALSWLHKACYGCAFELSTGKKTDKYIQYMLRKVDMMRSCGVAKVILVFDGQRLPLKSLTHEKRQRYKEENRAQALQAMAVSKRLQGTARQNEANKAFQLFQRSISITPEIISTLMSALRAAKVPFVVAPFEADAQMVWMCKEGLAAGIVTEDSDVVVYCLAANVSCPVLVKLDDNGSAQAVSRSILHNNSKASSNALLKKIHFLTSGQKEATRMFVQVCVLAGCDFIDSLPNVGFATAVKHIFNFRGAPAHLRVQRLVSKLSSSGTNVPSNFIQDFFKAETIFFHHLIFNSKTRSCELLIDEKHVNCFPDIVQRARESLGISPFDKVDVTSNVQPKDLHAAATATKSFLGKVLSREIVEQIYKGDCSKSLDVPREPPCAFDGHARKINQGFPTIAMQRHVRQLSPIATAQQIENKEHLQAKERAASLQDLMSIYKTTSALTTKRSISTTRTPETDPKHCDDGRNQSSTDIFAPSTSLLLTSAFEVKSSKVAATSMKCLLAKHSQSVQVAKSLNVQGSLSRGTPQCASESRKRSQPATNPVACKASSKKGRTLVHKSTPDSSRKTLFDFFQKQS